MAGRRRGSGARGFWSLGFFAAASPLLPAVVQSPGGGVKKLEAWECAGTVLSSVDDFGGLAEDGWSRHLRLRREAMMVAWRRLSADTRSAARFRRLRRMDYAAYQQGDDGKAGLLRRLVPVGSPPERLVLFEANLYDAASFAPAIAGCQFVFLVATPSAHEAAASKYKNAAEAAADAVRVILRLCEESKTVKRVIHTASVSAASPLTESSSATTAVYRDFISESCWTTLDADYPLRNAHFDKYIESKVLSEKQLLGYNDGQSPAFEVVTLPCGLVAGDTVLGHVPETVESVVAPVTGREPYFTLPRILQRLLGSVPLVHVDDVCAAHIFCMEQPSLSGRFLCAAAYPTVHDILDHYGSKYPHLDLLIEIDEVARVQHEKNKLEELGFRYKYGMEEILDESVGCAVRLGGLDTSRLSVQQK